MSEAEITAVMNGCDLVVSKVEHKYYKVLTFINEFVEKNTYELINVVAIYLGRFQAGLNAKQRQNLNKTSFLLSVGV